MYVPICELRRNSTMLPLRSRTSWRLRALTVTCLPRDWTRAVVYHFANNRRRGHNLPEGHPASSRNKPGLPGTHASPPGLADPRPRQGHPDPRALQARQDAGTQQAPSRRWTSSTGSLRRRHGHHPDQLRQQQSRQHHPRQRITNRYQLQLGKPDPTPDNTLPTASVPGQGRPGVPSSLPGA